MKTKTSELTGVALDWAVAKCEGKLDQCGEVSRIGSQLWCWEDGERRRYFPSGSWAQGGPIIEREGIDITAVQREFRTWGAEMYAGGYIRQQATTPLIAAMRCFVASKLGDEVNVPDELCQA